ncbi:hypothetical protein, conserved [Leishmania tarentolae]|uniref:Crossover junction endonuclease MUS81 n=1 Tax=Leishmania tarentolae TaxID=5689 RepID=A0A640KH12_LEITA|nr:hypothetical protein, conserved [Leishmania tarentolae]
MHIWTSLPRRLLPLPVPSPSPPMMEPQSCAPTTLCAGATENAAAASADVAVNARLCRYLRLHSSSQAQSQHLTSSVFLDALARYPLPVVSPATAQDVAGSQQLRQLHQLRTHSPSRLPSDMPSEPATTASASPVHIYRPTGLLRDEGRTGFSGGAQHAANDLTASIPQFWALLPVSAAATTPLSTPPTTAKEDARGALHRTAVSACGPTPQPTPLLPPPWAAFSPFRFCADPLFHAALKRLPRHCDGTVHKQQLRKRSVAPSSQRNCHTPDPSSLFRRAGGIASVWRSSGEGPHDKPSSVSAAAAVNASVPGDGSVLVDAPLGAPWTMIDAWCHGFAATEPDEGQSRKRTRTASPTSASPTSVEPQTFAHRSCSETHDGGNTKVSSKKSPPPTVNSIAAHGTLHTNVLSDSMASPFLWASPTRSNETEDALQGRVAENDDLLGLLLGVEQNASRSPESPGKLLCLQARLAETTEVAGSEVDMEGRSERIDLAKCDDGAKASRTRVISRLETSAVLAGSDGLATSCAQRNRMITPLASTAVATEAAMPQGPALGTSDADFSSGVAVTNTGERVLASTVKGLRDTCARLGLLSTGSKSTLQQRLHLYYASTRTPQESGVRVPLVAATETVSSSPHALCSPDAARKGGEVRAFRSTGSPPRTVFRYRSPSQTSGSVLPASASAAAAVTAPQPHACVAETVSGATTRTAMSAAWEHAATSGQRRHIVPSPTQFLQDLASRTTRPPHTALATLFDAHSPSSVKAARAQQEELMDETGHVRWQWLVDFRERSTAHGGGRGRRQHDGMLDVFRKQRVPCTSMMLPAGDFMLSVELSPEEAAAMHVSDTSASTEADAGVLSASSTAEGAAPVFSHVCSLIVERKTAADLDASVKGARYTEQRRLLAASPFRLVVWLIEGTDVAGGNSSGFFARGQRYRQGGGCTESDTQPGSRSQSPTPSSPVESARQRVDSACASLGLHGKGWLVVRTRNTTESVQFLKLLATQIARQLASYRLLRRCVGEDTPSMAAETEDRAVCPNSAQDPLARHLARTGGGDTHFGNLLPDMGDTVSRTRMAAALALLRLTPTNACLQSTSALQRHLRAKTALPRMLMCVRGCSAALASLLSSKYGSLLRFWRELRRRGREGCDTDPDIQRLTTAQKKVYVLLTEFLLAKDYL